MKNLACIKFPQVSGRLTWVCGGQSRLSGLDFDKLSSGFRWNWIARFSAVLQVQFDRLTNIPQCIFAGVSLADASGKRGNRRHEPFVGLLFKHYRKSH